jgi:isoamylase
VSVALAGGMGPTGTSGASHPSAARHRSGASHPLGATIGPAGVDFAVYARDATAMSLLLFDAPEDDAPAREVALDPTVDRTGPYWHTSVAGARAGQLYAWRADGPWSPAAGLRFDAQRPLLDPYGRGVAVPAGYRRETGPATDGLTGRAMKSVVIDLAAYDWEGDRPLERTLRETVIYEAHLRGLTASPGSPVTPDLRGTYRGAIEVIPYLVDLGVTAVELLPVHQFDRLAAPEGLINHWGYQTVGFFAPHAGYARAPDAQGVVDEFRDMVKAFHRAGLEVILDVVYNHTAEGGADGPTLSFRGLADRDYYALDEVGRYLDFTGCGNTLDAGNPIARRLVLDSLRYWVSEMHVDGFRFDLAAVLSRDRAGRPLADPPLIWDIDTDPVLAGSKLIAEAWDAAGLYLVGGFAGDRWSEWNGRFRDDVRSFVKSDPGFAGALAQRFLGSPDIYSAAGRRVQTTVNFVTCHDGFTLNDLVSYTTKHNEANGEGNRDGSSDDRSWGCGAEGPTDDPEVEALRARQVRNMLSLTLLSMGLPMILMGDEVRRTQQGNDNAYCHDDPTTWFDWADLERHGDVRSFVRSLIDTRRRLQALLGGPHDATLAATLAQARVELGGVEPGRPDLGPDSRSIAVTVGGEGGALHLMCNGWWEPLVFRPPEPPPAHGAWRRLLDTTLPGDTGLVAVGAGDRIGGTCVVGARSVVAVVALRATTG